MKYTFIGFVIALLTVVACGQSRTNRLYRPCPGVGQQARVEINRSGDVDLVPCSGRSLLLNGVPFSNGFTVSGASRTNYIPYFSSETNLAKSPFSWDGSVYTFNNPTGDSLYTMQFTPSPLGYFQVGTDVEDARVYYDFAQRLFIVNAGAIWPSTRFQLRPSGTNIYTPQFAVGDINAVDNSTYFDVNDSLQAFTFAGSGNAKISFSGIGNFFFRRTITFAGCGGVTINKPVGTANVCSGSTSVQVNNSIVNSNSIILPVTRTYDATCSVRAVVPDAGNFVIYMTAPCSGDTSIGWIVLN
jgi:hypothetical protein